MMPNWTVNPQCVGQAPTKIAKMAGFEVPPDTSIICAEIGGVGKRHPLSAEKLSPVLALRFVKDFNEALDTCFALLKFGGMGHTAVVHAKDDPRIREFALRMPAMRVLVNTPSPQGSTGITTNVFPSMTLGCGAVAGNITSDNVGPLHLINIKRLAYVVRQPQEAFEMPLEYEGGAGNSPAGGHTVAAQSETVDRQAVVAAVERYLAGRGAAVVREPAQAVPAPATPLAPEAPACGCGCGPKPAAGPSCSPKLPERPKPQEPPQRPVEFVCEADVRTAINEKRKIIIRAGDDRNALGARLGRRSRRADAGQELRNHCGFEP